MSVSLRPLNSHRGSGILPSPTSDRMCRTLCDGIYWPDQWVYDNTWIRISCTGYMFGTAFETDAMTDSTGHYTMDLMELVGDNPLEPSYNCQVAATIDGCCGEVQIITAIPNFYSASLGCSKYNRCGDPY